MQLKKLKDICEKQVVMHAKCFCVFNITTCLLKRHCFCEGSVMHFVVRVYILFIMQGEERPEKENGQEKTGEDQ